MRTTPRSYLSIFVYPNVSDYEREPDDARKGFNAAVSAFQLADIFYAFYQREKPEVITPWPKKEDLLKHLGRLEPYFLTVQSVATVYKHLYVRGGFYEVASPGSLNAVHIPGQEVDLKSTYEGAKLDVMVRRIDGTTVSLTNALHAVVEMWYNFLPDENEFWRD